MQAADRLELVIELDVGGGLRAEGGVHHRLDPLAHQQLRDAVVGGGLGEVDAVEADPAVEAERPPLVEADHAQLAEAGEQPLDQPAADAGAEPGDRDDAR